MAIPTTEELKRQLILETSDDDLLLSSYIIAATNYAEGYQHKPDGFYSTIPAGGTSLPAMSPSTHQAIILLAAHYYESRDGMSGGFFDSASGDSVFQTVDRLLTQGKDWDV